MQLIVLVLILTGKINLIVFRQLEATYRKDNNTAWNHTV
jgi:hypothetical protein